jgi:hypothetical protein
MCWARPSPGAATRSPKWLLERQAQSFDAVFVSCRRTQLAIHVDPNSPLISTPMAGNLTHATTPQASTVRLSTSLD